VSKEIIIAPEISNQSNGETTEIRNKTPAWEQKPNQAQTINSFSPL
jgi:hypothetical protein